MGLARVTLGLLEGGIRWEGPPFIYPFYFVQNLCARRVYLQSYPKNRFFLIYPSSAPSFVCILIRANAVGSES